MNKKGQKMTQLFANMRKIDYFCGKIHQMQQSIKVNTIDEVYDILVNKSEDGFVKLQELREWAYSRACASVDEVSRWLMAKKIRGLLNTEIAGADVFIYSTNNQ